VKRQREDDQRCLGESIAIYPVGEVARWHMVSRTANDRPLSRERLTIIANQLVLPRRSSAAAAC
jgi:hypothetical protein